MLGFEDLSVNSSNEALRSIGMTRGEDGVWRSPEGDMYDPSKFASEKVQEGHTGQSINVLDTGKFQPRELPASLDVTNTDTFIDGEVPKSGDDTSVYGAS